MARTNLSPVSRQKYLIPDSLVHSSGTITATIFGQAYNVAVGSPTAATFYYLYLLNNALVSATTIPSTYRASNPTAILVGAWCSNALTTPVWGSFMNIESKPTTGYMAFTPVNSWTGNVINTGLFKIDGESAIVESKIDVTGTPTPSVALTMGIPIQYDSVKANSPTTNQASLGVANGTGTIVYVPLNNSASSVLIGYSADVKDQLGQLTPSVPVAWVNTYQMNVFLNYPGVGLTNTPIKDL